MEFQRKKRAWKKTNLDEKEKKVYAIGETAYNFSVMDSVDWVWLVYREQKGKPCK